MTFNRAIPRAQVLALAVAAALAALPAAGAEKAPPPNPKFDKLDKNHDGYITRDEVRGIRDYGKAFDAADENKDGRLDRAEFIKAEAIYQRILAGAYVEDSVVTTKVKAALLKEPELNSLDVSVETLHGEVLLSGFVTDERQRQKALRVAVAVNGVASVKDAMVVR